MSIKPPGLVASITLTFVVMMNAATAAPSTSLVSVNNAGQQGNGASSDPSLSGSGTIVAFSSDATNLVSGDGNRASDVFLRDRARGSTRLLSRGAGGAANGASTDPAVSPDGRLVVFRSAASNLVPGDSNGFTDIFLRNVKSDGPRLISVGKGGAAANGESLQPAISQTGRYVAFASRASNLVFKDTNSAYDIFVRDRDRGATIRISVGPAQAQANGSSIDALISANGRVGAFSSEATNLAAGDRNGLQDTFVHDLPSKTTRLVSVGRAGAPANGKSFPQGISSDGRYVVFVSTAGNLVAGDTNGVGDVFVRDMTARRTTRVVVGVGGVQGNGPSERAAISADGRYVAFRSLASNLVPGDTNSSTDVFIRDLALDTITRLSVATDGTQARPGCFDLALSGDATTAAFACNSTTLVAGDVNGASDIFVRGPLSTARAPGS